MGILKCFAVITVLTFPGTESYCQQAGDKARTSPSKSILERYGSYIKPANECIALRDRTSMHYRIDRHTNIAILYTSPVFYESQKGTMEPISNRIIACADDRKDEYQFRNEANDVLLYFSGDASRCSIVDETGNELAAIISPWAIPGGIVSISENQVSKLLNQDSSEFTWTVSGSGVSYRLLVNRKMDTEHLIPVVRIDWRQPMITGEETHVQGKNRQMSLSTVFPDGNPDQRIKFEEAIVHTDTTTILSGSVTLKAGMTGSIYKSSVSALPVAAGSGMHIQNLSDPGCTFGYRAWATYDLSSLSGVQNILQISQYLYVTNVTYGFFDLVDMDITHLITDPRTAGAPLTWLGIGGGTPYVDDEAVVFRNMWESWDLTSASRDLAKAIGSQGWFGLGYMVWCDEDNSDFIAQFAGTTSGTAPYLVVVYGPNLDTDVEDNPDHPSQYTLSQNYPNPFNPTTNIAYSIPYASHVRLGVYDVLGRNVITLVNGVKQAGNYTIRWDAADISGGVYFYRIEATGVSGTHSGFTSVRKMMLTK